MYVNEEAEMLAGGAATATDLMAAETLACASIGWPEIGCNRADCPLAKLWNTGLPSALENNWKLSM